ncbi:MAG: methyltransferase domain-containing protein [Pseudomonadota bacterium]
MTDKEFLQGAYKLENQQQTLDLYADWAKTYDQELADNNYASPVRTAQAMALCGADKNSLLLDVGCGTGVSGIVLKEFGFGNLHGSDFSDEMLEEAEQKGIYAELYKADVYEPFKFVEQPYPLMTAVGVFAPGHADHHALHAMIDLMPIGGLFGFSMNDHALKEGGYMDEINTRVMAKEIRIRFQEYGDHIPGIGLNSMIMVLERIA